MKHCSSAEMQSYSRCCTSVRRGEDFNLQQPPSKSSLIKEAADRGDGPVVEMYKTAQSDISDSEPDMKR